MVVFAAHVPPRRFTVVSVNLSLDAARNVADSLGIAGCTDILSRNVQGIAWRKCWVWECAVLSGRYGVSIPYTAWQQD